MSDDYDYDYDDDYYDDDEDEEDDSDDDSSSSSSSNAGLSVNAGNKIKILINPPPYGYAPPGGYPPPGYNPDGYPPPRRYPTNIFGHPYNPMLDFVFNEMQRSPLPARNYGLVNDLFRIPIYPEGPSSYPHFGRFPFPRLPIYSKRSPAE